VTLVLEPSLSDLFHDAVARTARPATRAAIDHTAYQTDPIGWAETVLGVPRWTLVWSLTDGYAGHETDGTPDPIAAALEAIAQGKWTATSSGTGTGKTFGCAVLILWWLACWSDSVATTVATKEEQMVKGVWREIGRHWAKFQEAFPDAELTTLRIRMQPWRGDVWGAWGLTAAPKAGEEASTAVAGLHAEHLLILVDECPGVPQPIMNALVNTATGGHNIIAAWGNPDHQADPLATFGDTPGVQRIRISALDHPNVVTGRELIPGAATRGSIQRRVEKYGEQSPLYQSRVRGIAPEQSEHALIRLAWCHEAAARGADVAHGVALRDGPKALGVDVAQSENGDLAAIAAGVGAMLLTVRAFPCPNATALGRQVWAQMRDEGVRPEHVGVDPIGVGAATVNALDEQTEKAGLSRVGRCNGGAKALPALSRAADGAVMDWLTDANRFKNLRAQMYWQLREDLRTGVVGLPADRELFRELTLVQFKDEQGVVTIESKDDVRKRLGKSPDRADAVVYWNWVRPRTRAAKPVVRTVHDARPLAELVATKRPKVSPLTTPQYRGWRPV
jgi:phage terminase large subunit